MRFACINEEIRTVPVFSGQRAFCRLCGGELIGKCGEINIWHWQHFRGGECDAWKEGETEWHLNWKANFPDNWQEVIIEKSGEKHIADVRTENGIVIEFQNSSINASTIQTREGFYGRMIWVVNAKSFKSNFHIWSVVNSNIKRIESEKKDSLWAISEKYKNKLTSIRNKIDENSKAISENINKQESKFQSQERLDEIKNEFDDFVCNVIAKWSCGRLYLDFTPMEIFRTVGDQLRTQLREIPLSIEKLKISIESKEKRIVEWENLECIEIESKIFRLVKYETISPSDLPEIRVISKSTRETFFPDIRALESEYEFRRYQYQKHLTDFFFDPAKTIGLLSKDIETDKKVVSVLENSFLSLKAEIKFMIAENIENQTQVIKQELSELQFTYRELVSEKEVLLAGYNQSIQEKEETISALKEELESQGKIEKSKVMRESKGLYRHTWKNERKCWQVSSKSIFFDIGEDYLFEKVERGEFKKVYISKFLDTYLN
jgi:hypothetical protein